MEKCLLCKENMAYKSGSHVIPHFLIKVVMDEKNRKGRGRDVVFKISNRDYKVAIGRSVLPDQIREVMGDFEPDEVLEMVPEYVKDNIFCTECENFFAELESFYAGISSRPNSEDTLHRSTPNVQMTCMFWLSVFWRVSVTEIMGMSLKAKDERKARRDLNQYKHILNGKTDAPLNFTWCYKVGARLKDASREDAVSGIFFHPIHATPYLAIIGEHVVALYAKHSQLQNPEELFFGLEILLRKAAVNNQNQGENVFPIDRDSLDIATKKLNHKVAGVKLERIRQLLDLLHQRLKGKGLYMPSQIKDHIIFEFTHSGLPAGKKYTLEALVDAVNKVLPQYMQR